MRIAVLGDGSLTHTRRWCEFLDSRGHQVALFTFEEPIEHPVRVVRLEKLLPTNFLGYLSRLGRLKKMLRRFRPDAVTCLYVSGYGFMGALCGFHPLVVSALGSDLLVDYPRHLLHKLQIEYALRKADLVTTDSDSLSRVAAQAGAAPEKIIKIYMGIDDSIFHPPPGGKGGGPDSRPPVVISTRNLYPVYDLELLVEAAALVNRRSEAEFVICGDGPEREKLEKRSVQLGLDRNIEFTGKLKAENLARRLRAADIYVSTSRSDSTSVSLLEAMACGLVPVVTDIEANREWITDGENGLVIEDREPRSLAEAIDRAASDREFTDSARKTNFRLIRERGLWIPNMERLERAITARVDR